MFGYLGCPLGEGIEREGRRLICMLEVCVARSGLELDSEQGRRGTAGQ